MKLLSKGRREAEKKTRVLFGKVIRNMSSTVEVKIHGERRGGSDVGGGIPDRIHRPHLVSVAAITTIWQYTQGRERIYQNSQMERKGNRKRN